MGRRDASLILRVMVAALLLCAVAPASALALDFNQGNFTCGGQRGSGSTDATGRLYIPCHNEGGAYRPNILIVSAAGQELQRVPITSYATDVAPSPDGRYLYVFRSQNKSVQRWNRTAAGTYALDAGWQLADFPMWGANYRPLGEFLDTDKAGNIYVTSGTWTDSPARILKYRPDGSLITGFGDWQNTWADGFFYWSATGVAVSDDGAHVYVTEVGNNRVQRFDRQADGSYAFALKWGNDPALDEDPRAGWCGPDVRAGRFSAPYDVGVDGTGRVFVLNTSCAQVQVFTAAGQHIASHQVFEPGTIYIHGMSLADDGRVFLPEVNRKLTPTNVGGGGGEVRIPISEQLIGWARAYAAPPATRIDSWLWTPQGWQRTTFAHRRWIWMHPFAPGWMWAWTEGYWYAVRTVDVTAR